MKIVEQNQNLMILKKRNIFIFFVGAVFLIFGIVVFFRPSFFTEQPPLYFGFIFAIAGGLTLALAKVITIKLDKINNKFLLSKKGLIGRTEQEGDLDKVKKIELSPSISRSSRGSSTSYYLFFVLDDGEILSFDQGGSSVLRFMGRRITRAKTLGEKVAEFLNVPYEEKRSQVVNKIFSTIQNLTGRDREI